MGRGVLWHDGSKGIALVTRSGSYSLFKNILSKYYPNLPQDEKDRPVLIDNNRWHPVMNLQNIVDMSGNDVSDLEFAVMVRNPIERFRSSCARKQCSPTEGLTTMQEDVHFWSMESMGLLNDKIKYFLFPEQIDECAIWLGLPTPVPRLNEEKDSKKPVLNEKELELVIKQYYNDN